MLPLASPYNVIIHIRNPMCNKGRLDLRICIKRRLVLLFCGSPFYMIPAALNTERKAVMVNTDSNVVNITLAAAI